MNITEKDIQAVEGLLNDTDGLLGYAYLEPYDGERQEYVFEMTPNNIAQFLGAHFYDAREIVLTDLLDRFILNTNRGFIFSCPNQDLCKQIVPILSPIQTGDVDAEEIPMVTRDVYEAYGRYEDEMVTMAEMSMG